MTSRETRRHTRARCAVAFAAISVLALAGTAWAADAPDPVVLPDKAALPPGCASLGEISEERFMATSPRLERVQDDAVLEARKKGATHLVTESLGHCGAYSYCYTGVAYRCPEPGSTSSGK